MKKIYIIKRKVKKDEENGEKIMVTILDERTEISTKTNTRKSFSDIRKEVSDRRKLLKNHKSVAPVVYDATSENAFFEDVKKEIYKNISETEGDES